VLGPRSMRRAFCGPPMLSWQALALTTRTTSSVHRTLPGIPYRSRRSRPCRRTSTCPTSRPTSSIRPSRTSPAYALAFTSLALAVRPRGKRATLLAISLKLAHPLLHVAQHTHDFFKHSDSDIGSDG
jgi:hypothetical protein